MGLVGDLLFPSRKWFINNEDTKETIEGQFAPTSLSRDVANKWAKHTALGRGKTIIQYLNSQEDNLALQAAFFATDALETSDVEEKLNRLISWAKRDPKLGRPAIVIFWIGDGHLQQKSVIDSISGIQYGEPTILGAIREVTFTINLIEFEEFSLNDTELSDTRFHRARERDYYESLAEREYGQPLLGDVIRKRHPDQANLITGAIVALPSIEAIRTERVTQTSIPLKTAYGRKETSQRTLRLGIFNRRNRSFVSHLIVE